MLLRALGLSLTDTVPTVGWGKIFWWVVVAFCNEASLADLKAVHRGCIFSDVCYETGVLSDFTLCRWSIFDVSGTVSSNMLSFFFTGSMITSSALSLNLQNLMRKIS